MKMFIAAQQWKSSTLDSMESEWTQNILNLNLL